MRVGITLPQFRDDGEPALAAARAAEETGIDGVFVFDHLWPIGRPDRPALAAFPLLGALAVETGRITIGSLVARVSLLPNAVLTHVFATLHRMVGDRLVAGLGTGDRLSEPENVAYAIPYPPVARRLADLADCCRRLRALGVTTWVGGSSPGIRAVARAEAHALNLWGVAPDVVAAERGVEVTWGGRVPADHRVVAERLLALAAAGATWAICAPPYDRDPHSSVEAVAVARRALPSGALGSV
jgi:hypothetical protein